MMRIALLPAIAIAAAMALSVGRFDIGAARAASFDCAAAKSRTDRAICANPKLSAQDSALGAAYGQRLARDPSVRQIQRAWLAARAAGCGRNVACLSAFTAAQAAWLHSAGSLPATLPTTPGYCALTKVKEVTTRLGDSPGHPVAGSGSDIEETNGGNQVSYEQIPAVDAARAGDAVVLCLVSLPQDCPPGDDRGKVYAGADLRTLRAWSLPDAEHMCGGA
jgi:uncharacterized protein YecT (DUF1311 family)